MKCIPLNTNKYMSFSVPIKKEVIESDNNIKKKVITYNIMFMDTSRHNNRALSTSVDNLSEVLVIIKKGVYRYEYKDLTDRFNETSLPAREKFYSNLQLKNISDEEYKHAKKVWDHFKLKTIGEYHNLYVQADTAQLSDVFENFRSLCLFRINP